MYLHVYLIDRLFPSYLQVRYWRVERRSCCCSNCKFRIKWYVYWQGHINTSVAPGKILRSISQQKRIALCLDLKFLCIFKRNINNVDFLKIILDFIASGPDLGLVFHFSIFLALLQGEGKKSNFWLRRAADFMYHQTDTGNFGISYLLIN